MSCERETQRALRAHGRRPTVQRLKVAAALQHVGGRVTVEEIHALVTSTDPRTPLPLSTVYRTLWTLKALRLVSELHAGGRAVFEWIDPARRHHHLVCQRCGADQELPPPLLDRLARTLRTATGFEAYFDHLAITGRCRACGPAAAPGAPDERGG